MTLDPLIREGSSQTGIYSNSSLPQTDIVIDSLTTSSDILPDMEPRLISISGSARGTIHALLEDEVSIGREAGNMICINEPSISRRHCVIERAGTLTSSNASASAHEGDSTDLQASEFKVLDLESFNGTFVNGVPVKEQVLKHGDQIALGDVLFLFLTHEAEADLIEASRSDEGDLITRSTVRLRPEDALYLRPEGVAELPPGARVVRDLDTLLKISSRINSIRSLPELQTCLMELILNVIPAEREAILLFDEATDSFGSLRGWNRVSGADDSLKVSQTITNQVLREGIALLSNDLFQTEGLGERPSLIAARVCSVLCVPLIVFEKKLGVVYLDTSDASSRFDEDHLQLLIGIAGISAVAFENLRQIEWLEGENRRLREDIQIEHQMVGQGPAMEEVYRFISKVAPTNSTVLIRGESGTGKELAAHAIHVNSPRRTKPLIAINCSTLSESLLESELCGHEKGAFSGAIAQKKGKLEIADGGTLFLDEVGELTPAIQARLLRVIQEREFERLGGTRAIKVDIRIVAATNRNLEADVKIGKFRDDLYYRLNVVSVTMPPLRERREDIPLLANFFVTKYSKACKRRVTGISADARALLSSHKWPGNVRQLENVIEGAVVLGETDLIAADDLREASLDGRQADTAAPVTYKEAVIEFKKQLIVKTFKQANSNYIKTAKKLGMRPNNLHRLIRILKLKGTLDHTSNSEP